MYAEVCNLLTHLELFGFFDIPWGQFVCLLVCSKNVINCLGYLNECIIYTSEKLNAVNAKHATHHQVFLIAAK